jgi:uncharacterized membrane protein YagU involved in acid resistance
MRFSPVAAIVTAGLVAGTIDIGAACLINMAGPIVILHAIASGVLGKPSYSGGLNTAALGLVLQWAMSMVIAAIYIVASGAIPLLAKRWLSLGLAYGVAIFVVMSFVVVPLSNVWPKMHAPTPEKIVANLLAMLLFGVIVARISRATVD